MIPNVVKTWAPRGHTPVVRHCYRRDKISVISGISVSPERQHLGLYYQLWFGNIGQEEVCVFLRHLLRHLRAPLLVLLDNSQTHQGAPLDQLLRQHPRLRIEHFPSYAPDLNPDEGVWALAKHHLNSWMTSSVPLNAPETRRPDSAAASSNQNCPLFCADHCIIYAGLNIFGFSNTSSLVRSLKIHTPESVLAPCPNPPATAVCGVPMIGTAPASKIYALKIFDSRGGGSPESRVIAAMDRAITLRRNFNNGVPSAPVAGNGTEENPFKFDSLNIQIVNMSLGGPTLFAGRDVEDELTLEMLKVGITIVVSAGNDGFPAMTGSSPGTGIGTLTAGAASTSVHERVLRDVQFGVGVGALYRPTTHHQTAFFSARGPTADGRLDPDAVANGFASFAQGSCLGFPPGASRNACIAGSILGPISLVSGTSFSSPTTAGAAALLRHEVPAASAAQIRNSLIGSANPTVLGDGSGPIDQGSGFINLPAALGLLASGNVSSNVLPEEGPQESVRENIAELGFRTIQFREDRFSTRVENLRPGQVAQFFVRTRKDTDRLVVTLRNITPELAPSQQNVLFGDDIFFQVADAPTSFNRQRVPPSQQFVSMDQTVVVDNPQSGLVRVALQGDWTNAGRISADLFIEQHRSPLLPETAEGKVAQGQVIPIQIEVPAGRAQVVFELFWERDWASYPTSDIDLILLDPNGKLNLKGATLDSPERVVVNNPTSGTWTAFIVGFTVNGREEEFVLRAAADGIRLRANKPNKHKD